jgi:hypothetical protein
MGSGIALAISTVEEGRIALEVEIEVEGCLK